MELKTVDLKLLATFDHVWKILAWLLRFVFLFVIALSFSERTVCTLRGVLAILYCSQTMDGDFSNSWSF